MLSDTKERKEWRRVHLRAERGVYCDTGSGKNTRVFVARSQQVHNDVFGQSGREDEFQRGQTGYARADYHGAAGGDEGPERKRKLRSLEDGIQILSTCVSLKSVEAPTLWMKLSKYIFWNVEEKVVCTWCGSVGRRFGQTTSGS